MSTCNGASTKPEITVHVASIDTGSGGVSKGYAPAGSGVGPEILADTTSSVQQHQYRACDFAFEVVQRVTEPFQRLGYFCIDVEPIDAQQTAKNEYLIAIHLHPGVQYRLKEVTFSGAASLSPAELRSTFHMKPNATFDIGAVRRGLQAVQKAYAKKGHPNVTTAPVAVVDEASRTIALDAKIQGDGQP